MSLRIFYILLATWASLSFNVHLKPHCVFIPTPSLFLSLTLFFSITKRPTNNRMKKKYFILIIYFVRFFYCSYRERVGVLLTSVATLSVRVPFAITAICEQHKLTSNTLFSCSLYVCCCYSSSHSFSHL